LQYENQDVLILDLSITQMKFKTTYAVYSYEKPEGTLEDYYMYDLK